MCRIRHIKRFPENLLILTHFPRSGRKLGGLRILNKYVSMNAYKNNARLRKFVQMNKMNINHQKILSNASINKALKNNEVILKSQYPEYYKKQRRHCNNSSLNSINNVVSHRPLACATKSQEKRPTKHYCNFMVDNSTIMIQKKNIHNIYSKPIQGKSVHQKQNSCNPKRVNILQIKREVLEL